MPTPTWLAGRARPQPTIATLTTPSRVLEQSAERDQRIVFHCFLVTRRWPPARRTRLVRLFAGPITYPANDDEPGAGGAPGEPVLVETDAPYLPPCERGSLNASYVMAHTVRFTFAGLWGDW